LLAEKVQQGEFDRTPGGRICVDQRAMLRDPVGKAGQIHDLLKPTVSMFSDEGKRASCGFGGDVLSGATLAVADAAHLTLATCRRENRKRLSLGLSLVAFWASSAAR
jgi:hypothetical protein